jgi:hypothetical protein
MSAIAASATLHAPTSVERTMPDLMTLRTCAPVIAALPTNPTRSAASGATP